MSKRTFYGKIYRPDVCAGPHLSRGRVFTCGWVFTVRADGKKKYPRGHADAFARTKARPRGHRRVRVDAPMHSHLLAPRPPLYPLARPASGSCGWAVASTRTLEKKLKICFLFLVAGLKRKEKNVRISVFGFQSPRFPRSPSSAGFASEAARRRRFFGLVPLVTHPSSIPLLGGLTPKFLSLSFHSSQGLLMLMAFRIGTLWSLGNLIHLELNLCSIESNEGVTTNIIIIAP
jgi:hypothetical protein